MRSSTRQNSLRAGHGAPPLPRLEIAPDVIPYADGGEEPLFAHFSKGDFDDNAPCSSRLPWPLFYHLTPTRRALLNWIDFGAKPLSILELGAGCGAITSYLVEIPGASVFALEGARRRAEIIQQRCRNATNLTIHAGNIAKFEPKTRFDVVTLIGVLEYAGKYSSGEDPFRGILELASSWLTDSGCLILAIENRMGHKYLAGMPEDHYSRPYEGINGYLNYAGIKTFDRASLKNLLGKVGLEHQSWYYPFPDYKVPYVVVSDSGLDSPEFDSLTLFDLPTMDGSTETRPVLHERALLKSLRLQGSLAPFMNSFLVLASRSGEAPLLVANRNVLAFKTTLGSRGPVFQTKTAFLRETNGKVTVRRQRMHSRLVAPSAPCEHAVAEQTEAYHVGTENLLDALFDRILSEADAGTKELLRNWEEALIERTVSATSAEQEAFWKFSAEHLGQPVYHSLGSEWLPGEYLDLHPGNILLECTTGNRILIQDLEWRMKFKIPLQLVFDRGLYILANRLRRSSIHLRDPGPPTTDVPISLARAMTGWRLFEKRDPGSYGLFERWFQYGVMTSNLKHCLEPAKQSAPEPLRQLWETIRRDTSNVEAWGRYVTLAQELGLLVQAFALCREELNSHPQDLPLLLGSASMARMLGDQENAIAYFERVLFVDPKNSIARRALASFRTFDRAEDWYAAASNLLSENDTAAGTESLKELLKKFPSFAPAHNDLGILLLQGRMADAGLKHLEQAAVLEPSNLEILENLASIYGTQKRLGDQERIKLQISAISGVSRSSPKGATQPQGKGLPVLTPGGIVRLVNTSTIGIQDKALAQERTELVKTWRSLPAEAFRSEYVARLGKTFRRILKTGLQDEPLCSADQETVKLLESETGNAEIVTRSQLAALLYRRPHKGCGSIRASGCPTWLLVESIEFMLTPPPLFQVIGEAELYCEWLEAYVDNLYRMVKGESDGQLRSKIAVSFANHANYIQAYFNERNLSKLYRQRGEMLSLALQDAGVSLEMDHTKQGRMGGTLHVGVLLSRLGPSAETFATLPLLKHLGSDFRVYLYCLNRASSQIEEEASKVCFQYRILGNTLRKQVETIREDNLDVLYFATNVTAVTNPATALATFRLARIQVTGPACVTTTGMPKIDNYISGSLSDPSSEAASHYTERLIRIPGVAQCFDYSTEQMRGVMSPTRSSLGMGESEIVFASAANMFKIIPELLQQWARILARIAGSRLLLLPFGPNWTNDYPKDAFVNVLKYSFESEGVPCERVLLVDWPGLDRDGVRALLSVADVYLDSFPFSSTTSLMEPLEAGVPVICRQGEQFRGAMGAAILRELGIPDLIATSDEAYVDLAERLAGSGELRKALKERIKLAMSGPPRFRDPSAYGREVATAIRNLVSAE